MIGKELSKIEEKDLQDLIDNVVLEGKTIEYKGALPGNSDGDKKEFLADVSSFANAGGGDLIFGMTEDPQTKEPKSLDGLDLTMTVDQEKARLDNMIREGVEPRMPAVHIHPVSLKNGKTAIVIRVGKSWVSPHRVTYKGHDKFYSRNSSGKYPLDVGELRIAFTLSETITERIRRFREERIARLYANETPVPMEGGAKIVLQIVPLTAFTQSEGLDIAQAQLDSSKRAQPMRSAGTNSTFTLDGFITYSSKGRFQETGCYSYGHIYRRGIVEYVEQSIFSDDPSRIPTVHVEMLMVQTVRSTVNLLSSMNVMPPFFVFFSLVGVKGYRVAVPSQQGFIDGNPHPITEEVLLLPEAVIENLTDDVPKALRLTFDTLWNAGGHPLSVSYNGKGEWIHPDRPI